MLYKHIFNNAPVGIATIDKEGKLLTVNRTFSRIFSCRKRELLKMTFHQLQTADARELFAKKINDLWTGRLSRFKLEHRCCCRDGQEIDAALHGSLVSDRSGRPLFIVIQVEDITKRKLTEARIEGLSRLKEDLIISTSLEEKARIITDGVRKIFNAEEVRLWVLGPGDRCRDCFHNHPHPGEEHNCTRRDRCFHLIAASGSIDGLTNQCLSRIPFNCSRFRSGAANEKSGCLCMDLSTSPCNYFHEITVQNETAQGSSHRLISTDGKILGLLTYISIGPISSEEENLLESVAGTTSHVLQTTLAQGELRRHKELLEELVKQRTDKLKESEERLNFAMEGASDGLWDFYPVLQKTYYSPRWFTMLGYEPDQFPHTYETWAKLLHPKDSAQVSEIVTNFLETKKEMYNVEFRMRTASGDWRWIMARGKAVEWDRQGNITRMVGTHTDITDRKHIEAQFRNLVEELERANKELEDFAYIVSHDLKAPLRGISSLADWLKEDYGPQLDETGNSHLSKLLSRTRRMHNLIEDILAYSRVGKTALKPQVLDAAQLVTEVLDGLAIPESISITIIGKLPMVFYDGTCLLQVFQNLIGNSIKHLGKPQGVIRISCRKKKQFYEFCVADTGVGIEEQHRERIFQIFQSLDVGPNHTSTGIGLSLVKKIVELNGGTIRLESTPGEGSAFYFTVPIKSDFNAVVPLTGSAILIIDDNPEFVEVCEAMLELEGYKTFTAFNTPEAIAVLKEQPIEVVLMDVHIPGEDVHERLRLLKQNQPGLKIIACTGKDLNPLFENLYQEGVQGLIRKPFKIDELNRVIGSVKNKP